MDPPRIIIEGRRAAKKAERDDKRKAKRERFISAMIRKGRSRRRCSPPSYGETL